MKCPKCGSFDIKVVTTKIDMYEPHETIRRRKCNACDNRWYTAQSPERLVKYVSYVGKLCYLPSGMP